MGNPLSTAATPARTHWIDRLVVVAAFIPLNGRLRLKLGGRGRGEHVLNR